MEKKKNNLEKMSDKIMKELTKSMKLDELNKLKLFLTKQVENNKNKDINNNTKKYIQYCLDYVIIKEKEKEENEKIIQSIVEKK